MREKASYYALRLLLVLTYVNVNIHSTDSVEWMFTFT